MFVSYHSCYEKRKGLVTVTELKAMLKNIEESCLLEDRKKKKGGPKNSVGVVLVVEEAAERHWKASTYGECNTKFNFLWKYVVISEDYSEKVSV